MKRDMKVDCNDDFYFFLNWLAEEKDFSASEVANVVYHYWKYEKLWEEYNKYADKKADELMNDLKKWRNQNEKSI